MRLSLLLLFAILLPTFASAQTGTITYDESVKMDIELPPEMESMRDQIPNSRTSSKLLHFSDTASLLMAAPKSEEHEHDSGAMAFHGDGMAIRIGGPDEAENATFTNLEDGSVIEKRDFLGRIFLITGEREEIAWRMTGEQSEYLGYACMKAVAQRDSSTVEAWFTPEIPLSIGPGSYRGLPGAILVVSVDDGQTTWTAKEVTLGEVDQELLAAPEGGREVSREEFDQIVEEKMEEMGATRGRGGNRMMIRIQN